MNTILGSALIIMTLILAVLIYFIYNLINKTKKLDEDNADYIRLDFRNK